MQEISLGTFLAVYLAGILTSISPCVLAMIPVLIGFIGGYGQPSRLKAFLLAVCFVLGMSVTFAILGMVAVAVGNLFGQVGPIWYLIIGGVSISMGLQLWGVWQVRFPGLKMAPPKLGGELGAFVAGLFFGIVASPCATPVLVAILAMATATSNIGLGGLLLFTYGLGHGFLLLIVGTCAGLVKGIRSISQGTNIINYFSGAILILIGLYFIYLGS
ncbi:hypothetical protein DCMF_16805 [Candidatus Formimonas warabiya]|uniref:Cytochrome C biogenesis protein transmembrane domain-containing protein n=1 Tax=Formimonas warabiya TaxID=1761012 RepID=A0A3G1L200_FORW1|nr:hypothetical protein DCMF_16805 [Candidatus Formimonas warabiya]